MTAKARAEYWRTEADSVSRQRKHAPDESLDTLPALESLPSPTLWVDGQRLEVLEDLQGDYPTEPLNSARWIASQRILVTDDLAFNGVHPWLRGSTSVSRAARRKS